MTDNPYAGGYDDHGPGGDDLGFQAEPDRTSILAILSLVCSILCILSPIGLILGIVALIGIGASRGRVGGKGIAIAGLVLGVVGTAAVGTCSFGAISVGGMITGQASGLVEAIDAGDNEEARKWMIAPGADATDEEFEVFRQAYREAYGEVERTPDGLISLFQLFGEIGDSAQGYSPTPGAAQFPMPVVFSNGGSVFILEFPQGGQPTAPENGDMPISNILILMPDGSLLPLVSGTGTTAPATPQTPETPSGEAPEADNDEAGSPSEAGDAG